MALLNELEKNENVRKLFGKRELVIIKKQLLGVRMTQSEKNRLSRDIRKKFEAISDLSKFQDEFSIKRGNENKKLIEKVKDEILSMGHKNIQKIFLFGSAVSNEMMLMSDIDIAVEFKDIEKKDAEKFRLDILKNFSERLDIQVFNVLPEKIKTEILNKGRVIYETKERK